MPRKLKCQWCGVTDSMKEEMICEQTGGKKPTNKYYHKDCHVKFLEKKAFNEQEKKELDELVEVIYSIYHVKVIPDYTYTLLQELRNGTKNFGRNKKKYKEGYSYSLIAKTFEYCINSINYANGTKEFDGFVQAFKYGLAIVTDKLPIVEQKEKEKEMRKEISKRKEAAQSVNDESIEIFEPNGANDPSLPVDNYSETVPKRKKKDEMDISDLLGF